MKYTTKTWIEAAKMVHGDSIIYDDVVYNNSHGKVHLKCAVCGYEFWQEAREHLNGSGCRRCAMKRVGEHNHKVGCAKKGGITTDDFISRAKSVHGDAFDYSLVDYVNMGTKVCIKCNKCGNVFYQTPRHHIHRGHGCPMCNGGIKDSESDFLAKALSMYGDSLDFSKVEYIKSNEKVCVICHRKSKNGVEHGEFMITPNALLSGHGCPHCKQSTMEGDVKDFLTENNIKFSTQKTFDWLRNSNTNGKLRIDFYLPEYNVGIECQGIQHFFPTDFAGRGKEWANKHFLDTKQRDERKKILCSENGIRLIYYSTFTDCDGEFCNNKDELIKLIKK